MAEAPETTTAAPSAPSEATQATTAPSPEGQAPAAPAAPGRDPSLPPRHAELGKWAAGQKAKRDEQAQREADARDAAAFRSMLAQGYTPREAAQQVERFDLNDYDALAARFASPKELQAFLNGFAKHVANPAAGRLHREVEALKTKPATPPDYDEIKQTVKQLQDERARETQAATDRAFLTASEAKDEADAPRFPLLSKHPEAQRFAIANQVIADYRAAGFDGELPMDLVLEESESLMAQHYQSLGFVPAPAPAAVPNAKPTPSAKRSPSTPPPRKAPGPRSLSNDDVATPSDTPPADFAARVEWARRRAEQRSRAAG